MVCLSIKIVIPQVQSCLSVYIEFNSEFRWDKFLQEEITVAFDG